MAERKKNKIKRILISLLLVAAMIVEPVGMAATV